MSVEYFSFERVLKELQIEEDELRRLVSEGEIRAFRDEDKMKFKKSDIEVLKKGRMTEPTIILPSSDADDSSEDSEVLLVEEDTSETLLDIDDLETATDSSTTVPTLDFSSDLDSNEGMSFEHDSSSYVLESADDVLVESSQNLTSVSSDNSFFDPDTGSQTEPLDMDVASDLTDSSVDAHEEDESMTTRPIPRSDVSGRGAAAAQRAPITQRVTPVAIEEPLSNGMVACCLLTGLFMLLSGFIMMNSLKDVDDAKSSWATDVTFQYLTPAQYLYKGDKVNDSDMQKHMKWRAERRKMASKKK